MKNKVLIQLIVPNIDEQYDLFIPINIKIGEALNLIGKSLKELNDGLYIIDNKKSLYDCTTGTSYHINDLIINTNIRNGSKLMLA